MPAFQIRDRFDLTCMTEWNYCYEANSEEEAREMHERHMQETYKIASNVYEIVVVQGGLDDR